jgi:cytochrome c oxidase subunit 3
MIHIVLVMAVATICLLFSYFYLHANAPAWPPDGYNGHGLLLPTLATFALGVGSLLAYLALRAIRRGLQAHLKLWLTGAVICVGLFAALALIGWSQDQISISAHAYGSIFLTIGWYQITLVIGALVLLGVVLVQAWLGYFDTRRFLAVQNAAIYCAAIFANWMVVFAVLYATPYLR